MHADGDDDDEAKWISDKALETALTWVKLRKVTVSLLTSRLTRKIGFHISYKKRGLLNFNVV